MASEAHMPYSVGRHLYKPLNTSRSHIRLLKIRHTFQHQSIVKCQMTTVPILSEPKYNALSYVWGERSVTEDISVNGRLLPVTENLASALKHLRRKLTILPSFRALRQIERVPRLFWIDAICINQEDIEERSQQVQMMKSIYQNASFVISWLGPTDATLDLALTSIEIIGANLETRYRPGDELKLDWMNEYPILWKENTDEGTGNKAWNAIRSFLRLKYWFRIWIVQEVAYAKRCLMMLGERVVPFRHLKWVAAVVRQIPHGSIPKPDFVSERIWRFFYIHSWFQEQLSIGTISLLQDSGKSVQFGDILHRLLIANRHEATDPKDKIYALLGNCDSPLVPDYSSPVEAVYCKYATMHVESTETFQFLSFIGVGMDMIRQFNLPSWVPDWDSISKPRMSLFLTPWSFGANTFLASASKKPFVGTQNDLHVEGLHHSSVLRVEPQLEPGSNDLFQFCRHYASVDLRSSYRTGAPYLQAIAHILLAGMGANAAETWNPSLIELHVRVMTFVRLALPGRVNRPDNEVEIQQYLGMIGLETDSNFMESYRKVFFPALELPKFWPSIQEAMDATYGSSAASAVRSITTLLGSYRFFHATGGYIGMAPPGTLCEDTVCLLNGCTLPVLLRKVGSYYLHVGPCFVLGLMEGEAAEAVQSREMQIREFEIH